jgi:DNA-binding response OmpR family regulator
MDIAEAIAVRLADEGVPLRAIARATAIPSPQLYDTLVRAKMDGSLLTLPRDDWPPGCPRDQRSLQLSRLAADQHDTLIFAIKDIFKLTPTGARIFLLLVQHEHVPHARIDLDHKLLVVNICKMRRFLRPFDIVIKTLWGYGYQLSASHRHKAMEMILANVEARPVNSCVG